MTSKTINYGRHYIDQDDISAVVEVLKSQYLTQGEQVELFEKELAEFVGAKYAVAMNSWTSGLHLAYIVSGINQNKGILTSPITFAATANAAYLAGSFTRLCDIENGSANIAFKEIESYLAKNKDIGAIVPVHYAGMPCEMDKIQEIANHYNVMVIEDAAHALGSSFDGGKKVGSCQHSSMTGFSFHPVKSIATGEGGMITTNDEDIYRRLLKLRSHGINKLDDSLINKKLAFDKNGAVNPWYYEVQEVGFNFRITDFQCALGRSQLKKLPIFLKRRKELVARYDNYFKDNEFIRSIQHNGRHLSGNHLYPVRINFSRLKISRAELMNKLSNRNIVTQVHYIPLNYHPFYKSVGFSEKDFKNVSDFYDEALSLPLYYSLTNDEQDYVCCEINKIIKDNS